MSTDPYERIAKAGATAARALEAVDDPGTMELYDAAGNALVEVVLRLRDRGLPPSLVAAHLLNLAIDLALAE